MTIIKIMNVDFWFLIDRQMIMTGCVAFAQHTGSARLIEELLPQCWEQVRDSYRSINANF